MRPRVGCRNLVSRLKQVVLPAPFGPISACTVPRSTRRLTPLTATKPANSLVSPSVSRMHSAIGAFPWMRLWPGQSPQTGLDTHPLPEHLHLEGLHRGRPDPPKSDCTRPD